MIYLLVTIGGVGLLIIGLYLMSFGFGVPPSFGLFFLGLCLSVMGMLMIALFAGGIDLQSLKIETTPKIPRRKPRKEKKPTRRPRPGVMEKLKTEIKPKKETPTKKPKKEKGTNFVKERLRSLKRRYMDDVEGVDAVIEERMSPFVGVLDKMKSTIIWSFDAFDVQDTMRDILTGANESIILMYPWIRNLDISILKKFMDTKSRVIIQEASLDDDASVELIKLLMDNNVDIRTMPHIHTVAAVVDNKKGLIISTDPIYDSFEVGVVYDDRRSIKEIEKLFEKAWSLSKEISIGG
ncbi:hypothetical protein MTTB_11560 [Methanothermobacter tenebrarum]|uniref:Uncharacterized protein n=1 Tax=Methanothermobacter tenebrarum TaxID=680118 RepID=A0ABN6PC16_9EURY|nr:hypothetical protein [Methanothermobacter tenebrarum]BDH79777.1 hypothetical protein MTTB_11560 [Methanothermobacter tenebrarum]